ncbi:UPF0236 family transposase-like protein [Spiroplasma endosymbiont of Labia minor]|uniref:UPF0236 family transposase-like protein n=1 Tax=Spiroplasma endosymbiont of Labia minor TaxID=3066305 RepID=UPI0030CB86BD
MKNINSYEIKMNGFNVTALDQIEFFDTNHKNALDACVQDIVQQIEQKDLEIKHASFRFKEGWIIDGYVSRKLLTSFGEIKFKVTRYFNKITKQYKVLVFDFIGIKKYERVATEFKQKY